MTRNSHDTDPYTAVYHEPELPEFQGNPLIEALPPIYSEDDWIEFLDKVVHFSEAERNLENHIRSHCIMRMQRYFQPLQRHIDLALMIDLILRQGYVGRNPVNAERNILLQNYYEKQQQGSEKNVAYNENIPIITTSLIGTSGLGKTTTIERIIGAYPQLIDHPSHGIYQLTYLKIDCPSSGTIGQLAKNFIAEIDRVLGTKHYSGLKSKPSVDELLRRVLHLASSNNLGILIVDEIQNLSVKKSGGREVVMNFFQEICNEMKVPILLMGTMKGAKILELDLRQARRNTAVGSFYWDRLEGEDWDFFIESMWRFQWVTKPVQLTQELIEVLYEETQGIVAIVTAVFMIAQMRAISTGEETLSTDLIRRVIKQDFAPLRKILNALRSNDPGKIAQFEDVMSIKIEEMLAREQQAMSYGSGKTRKTTKPVASAESQALASLEMMFGDPQWAELAVEKAVMDGEKTVQGIVRHAMNQQMEASGYSRDDSTAPGDLRKKFETLEADTSVRPISGSSE